MSMEKIVVSGIRADDISSAGACPFFLTTVLRPYGQIMRLS